jgi:hypothetical protein
VSTDYLLGKTQYKTTREQALDEIGTGLSIQAIDNIMSMSQGERNTLDYFFSNKHFKNFVAALALCKISNKQALRSISNILNESFEQTGKPVDSLTEFRAKMIFMEDSYNKLLKSLVKDGE